MTTVAWTLLRRGGPARPLLLAGSTAAATGLLLVALTMVLLPEQPDESLFNLVAEPGLRGGTSFATGLFVLPLLLMLYQVVRLGTATRERRLAALRLAGATPREVRALGAVEVGLPVVVGAAAGPLVHWLLQAVFGGQPLDRPSQADGFGAGYAESGLALVPTSVTLAWWQTVAVVLAVSAAGVLTGVLGSRHLVTHPLGLARRHRRPAPRPWGLLIVGLGLALGVAGFMDVFGLGDPVGMAAVLLVVVGVVTLAPWVAYRAGQRAARRTGNPATLIAAARLTSDPRPAGRAAAAVGAVGLVSGGSAALEADVFVGSGGRGFDSFFVVSFVLVAVALLLALLVTTSTLAVHAVESLVDRRRVLSGLVAAGAPVAVLRDALRREATLTALPLATGGAVLGAVVVTVPAGNAMTVASLLVTAGQVALTIALTWLAIRAAVRFLEPWLRSATSPANLRTE
ncbi:MAG: FtsX-like permease family protein [Actinomycetes bacterium]